MKTFELEDYFFHYINDLGLSVLCMTDKKFNRKTAFAFLQDLKKALLDYYSAIEIRNATTLGLATFNETINEKIVSFESVTGVCIGVL